MTVLGEGVIVSNRIVAFGTGCGCTGTYILSYDQPEDIPGQTMTGDYLDMYAASFNVLLDHYSSTCRMGDQQTQEGVVDGRLNVRNEVAFTLKGKTC